MTSQDLTAYGLSIFYARDILMGVLNILIYLIKNKYSEQSLYGFNGRSAAWI